MTRYLNLNTVRSLRDMEKDSKVDKGQVGCEPASGLTLKPATTKDCKILWQWRNDPGARKYFPNTEYVPYREHKEWFKASLKNESRYIFIILQNNTKIGVVRFDVEPMSKSAEIHINISRKHRHQEIGRKVLKEASHYALRNLGIDSVIGRIKKGNEASIRAFTYAGFMLTGQNSWITMTLSLNNSPEKVSRGLPNQNR